MSSRELTERFFGVEQELKLCEKEISAAPVWEYVRFSVHARILEQAGYQARAHSARTMLDHSRIAFRSVCNFVCKNPYLAGPTEVVFFGHQRRKLECDGTWWDIYCDPILDHLQHSYIYIEKPYLGTHMKPAKTHHLRYLDALYVQAASTRLTQRVPAFTSGEKGLLAKTERAIWKHTGARICLTEIAKRSILRRMVWVSLYRGLLERMTPKLAVVVVGYGKRPFVEACKAEGIPVAELQHGVLGRYHLGYSYPSCPQPPRSFPDYLLTFGSAWGQMAELPLPQKQIIPVGFPYFELQQSTLGNVAKERQVLFLSQGTVGRQLSKLAAELRSKLAPEYNVVYKLHPGEYRGWQRAYPWLDSSDVKVVDDDSIPLYGLLASSEFLVGVGSTAIYEGLALGGKAILVNLPGVEAAAGLLDGDRLPMVSTTDELLEALHRYPGPAKVDIDRYFAKDAIANTKSALARLVSDSENLGT